MCLRHFAIALALLGLAAVAGSPAYAVEEDALALILTSPKSRIVLGEPLYLTARMLNQRTTMVSLLPAMGLEAQFLKCWVRGPDGSVREHCPPIHADLIYRLVALYPGEELSDTYMLLWGYGVGHDFPTPGHYAVVATYVEGPHSLNSNVLAIEVLEPTGVDSQALPLVLNDQTAEFLVLPDYYFQEGIANLRELLETYPRSTYAPYAAYVLSWRASEPGWFCPQPGSGILDPIPPNYDYAIAGFQRVLRDWPDSVVADDAQCELARTYSDMGDRAAAGDALQTFFETFAPTSDRLGDAIKLAEHLGWETARAHRAPTADTQWAVLRAAPGSDRFTLTWFPNADTARVTQGRMSIALTAGRPVAALGPRLIPLTAAPRIENGVMLVPTSFTRLLPRLLTEGRQLDPIPLPHLATIGG